MFGPFDSDSLNEFNDLIDSQITTEDYWDDEPQDQNEQSEEESVCYHSSSFPW
jgi:hypothetical protein